MSERKKKETRLKGEKKKTSSSGDKGHPKMARLLSLSTFYALSRVTKRFSIWYYVARDTHGSLLTLPHDGKSKKREGERGRERN